MYKIFQFLYDYYVIWFCRWCWYAVGSQVIQWFTHFSRTPWECAVWGHIPKGQIIYLNGDNCVMPPPDAKCKFKTSFLFTEYTPRHFSLCGNVIDLSMKNNLCGSIKGSSTILKSSYVHRCIHAWHKNSVLLFT